jgi:IPT/TIG domain
MLTLAGRRQHLLSRELRGLVPGGSPPVPGGLLGLELEFSLRSETGCPVDFGSLIHRLGLEGSLLDPGDPNAYRCAWGGVITCDGAEAEIATPPVRTRPGFTAEMRAWAEAGEAALRDALPAWVAADGYSAHLSAAMPAGLNDRVCRLYAETFAADLMLLMDRAGSPGLQIRPRPGRTELCGEFIQAETLAAVAAFVAGTTRACVAAITGRRGGRMELPPRLAVRPVPAVQRYGWYVDRLAFGTDLQAASRHALLPRASGGTICAQSHLELAWEAARQALAGQAAACDLEAAEAMVTGQLPLPAERGSRPGPPARASRAIRGGWPVGAGSSPPPVPCARPGYALRPIAAPWDFAVFEARAATRGAYVCVPRDSLPGFLDVLHAGAVDGVIAGYLARPSRGRVLSEHRQTTRTGIYDQIEPPSGLLAPERDPQTGRREQRGGTGKRLPGRPGKRDRRNGPHRPDQPDAADAPQGAAGLLHRAAGLPRRGAGTGRWRASRPAGWPGRIGWAILAATLTGVIAVLLPGLHPGTAGAPGGHSAQYMPPGLLSFAPAALAFPATPIGATLVRSVTVRNGSGTPITLGGARITGPGRTSFSLPPGSPRLSAAVQDAPAAEQPCHLHVLPGASCIIIVAFTPAASSRYTARLDVSLSGPLRPRSIALTGTAVRARQPGRVAVSGIFPRSGRPGGGTRVTITGLGFTRATAVRFGTVLAGSLRVDSARQITVTSPAHGPGIVDVTVVAPAGTSARSPADQFAYSAPGPGSHVIDSVSPASGSTAGGDSVTLTGSGFTGATAVHFGTLTASSYQIVSDSEITATSPASDTAGPVDITITTPGGTSPPPSLDQFTYYDPSR